MTIDLGMIKKTCMPCFSEEKDIKGFKCGGLRKNEKSRNRSIKKHVGNTNMELTIKFTYHTL